jgi:hypothetical protein
MCALAQNVSWSDDRILRVWDLADQRELKRYSGDNLIFRVIFSRERQLLLAGDTRGRMFFFNLPG